jgi:hypothetical protein
MCSERSSRCHRRHLRVCPCDRGRGAPTVRRVPQ